MKKQVDPQIKNNGPTEIAQKDMTDKQLIKIYKLSTH